MKKNLFLHVVYMKSNLSPVFFKYTMQPVYLVLSDVNIFPAWNVIFTHLLKMIESYSAIKDIDSKHEFNSSAKHILI